MSAQSFGKYQLIRKLATGGMAEVWLAVQSGIEGFQRQLVIKRILPHLAEDREFVQMFLNEAKISAKFSHPNIGQIFDLGHVDGTYYIAMEFIQGEDLGRVMRKAWSTGQWISRPLAIRIVASACEGLAYAHAKADEQGKPLRVVHRDISPQNILISFDGSVKLVDFGIAKAADHTSMTKSGAIKGKFAYMSPEQAAGKSLDQRSDIFAIGLVLYELLTGVRPLKRESELATLQAALECHIEPPSQVAEVPPELDAVLMRALAKSASDRYDDARQFQLALEEFLVSQRWVAGSVQIAELMNTLFADRLKDDVAANALNPSPSKGAESMDGVRTANAGEGTPSAKGVGPLPSAGGRAPSELSWDAPPGASNPGKRVVRGTPRSSPSTDAAGAAAEPWTAPPAATPAPRRRSTEEPSQAARPTALRQSSSRVEPAPTRARSRTDLDEARDSAEDSDTTPPPPKRTFTAGAFSRGTGVQPAIPEAPPRREPRLAPAPEPVVPATPAARSGFPLRKLVGIGFLVALVAAVGLSWRFIEPYLKGLGTDEQARPVYIRADSSLHCQVYVRHAEKGGPDSLTYLGETPLVKASGAHIGDTIILENKTLGARYEQLLEYGQPGETKVVRKEFKTGRVMPRLREVPPHSSLSLYLDGQKVAEYNPKLAFEMVEGSYHLEVRGDELRAPAPLDVTVIPGKTTPTAPLDLQPFLAQ